jgi:hypothetical protein
MKIEPLHPGLGISYQIRFNKVNRVFKGADGEFAGVTDKRRKAIGISVTLTGALASKYMVQYAVRFAKNGSWNEASDGAWSGKNTGPGAAIMEFRCEVKPR